MKGLTAGVVFAAALTTAALLYVYLASEAVIQRRYPLTSTTVHAQQTSKEIARGAHLIAIAGCADCHGTNLQGRLLYAKGPLPVYAGNLLRDAQTLSDDEFERAIRYAVTPGATSMWFMPSGNYTYMSEDDVASIIAYLRSCDSQGAARPAPRFDFTARVALLKGELRPAFLETLDSPSSLDMGPRYDGGRYLARIACGECHGTDLEGRGTAPDLSRISLYDRPALFALLRQGYGAKGRVLPVMHGLARTRFHGFADYEIMALYDYLDARAHASPMLIARAEALRRHEEEQKKASDLSQ